jgi:formylglycine-generating enzyme required for sulfatase activity/nucleoside phosphorylase/energy-coupling factor transporter ATP-binding protein EcfA2
MSIKMKIADEIYEDYLIREADLGVIVALTVECAAVLSMLDNYETIMPTTEDPNVYYLGTLQTQKDKRSSGYRIVAAKCPKMGNNGAAMVAKDLIRTFRVKHVVMVGIAAGVPAPKNPEKHVRLGDIVVSYGKGVVQYDLNKRHPDGSLEIRSALPPPSRVLIGGVDSLEVARLNGHRPWEAHINLAGDLAHRPNADSDKLYIQYGRKKPYWKRIPHPSEKRPANQPKVHYGLIGSGNCLMKDIRERDRLVNELGILAIEMEGAGVADATWDQTEVSDYLIIRGISDYADRNKNDEWHPYAAVAAAAYLRALLEIEPFPPLIGKRPPPQVNQNTFQETSVRTDSALIRYLKWVKNSTKNIVLRGYNKSVVLPLSNTFVSFDLSTTSRLTTTDVPSRQELEPIDFSSLWPTTHIDNRQNLTTDSLTVPAESILSIDSNIVVLGAPGSGKTTILQYIAHVLSESSLSGITDASERLGIMGELPVPVVVPLNAFANHLQNLPEDANPSERTLLRFIEHYIVLRQANLRLPPDFFSDFLSSGQKVVLLLDGLEEIADEVQRIQISRAIEDLTQTPHPLSVVVTSRPTAYHGETMLPPFFHDFHIPPWDRPHIRTMIEKICTVIYDDEAKRERSIDEIIHSVETLEERRRVVGLGHERLIENPLMVRILITLHLRHGRIADRRTELFRDYIETLLQASYHPDIAVAHRLSESAGSLSVQQALLSRIAFELHMKSEQGISVLSSSEIDRVLASQIKETPCINEDDFVKQKFLEAARQRGGLLNFNGEEYRFTHLAFQEFLTGQYLEETYTNPKAIVEFLECDGRISRSWWREPVIHGIGLMQTRDKEKARRFVELLGHLDDLRVSDAFADSSVLEVIGEASIEHRFEEKLRERIAQRIQVYLFQQTSIPSMTIRQRADLGRIIGILGDTRPDVACRVPAMVKINDGSFEMGHPIDRGIIDMPSLQSDVYDVYLDEYWISKYPVTNSQFEEFVLAGGYSDEGKRFWTDAGWEWKSTKGISSPAYWDNPTWRIGNHPVVGVSWFESVAYCHWLSEVTRRQFRLSTEAEWEKGVGGAGIWPWGPDFSPEQANTSESGIGRTTCVGLFMDSGSTWGIHDAAGNVWEWCNSQFRTYGKYNAHDGREDINGVLPRCIRGGSWLNNKDRARVANRDHYFSGDRHFDLGFRVAETR